MYGCIVPGPWYRAAQMTTHNIGSLDTFFSWLKANNTEAEADQAQVTDLDVAGGEGGVAKPSLSERDRKLMRLAETRASQKEAHVGQSGAMNRCQMGRVRTILDFDSSSTRMLHGVHGQLSNRNRIVPPLMVCRTAAACRYNSKVEDALANLDGAIGPADSEGDASDGDEQHV